MKTTTATSAQPQKTARHLQLNASSSATANHHMSHLILQTMQECAVLKRSEGIGIYNVPATVAIHCSGMYGVRGQT